MNALASFRNAPALMAAAVFAVAGGGFVVATLVMARVLDEQQFSSAVIMIALCNVAIAAAPAGVNGIALRHQRRSDRRLLLAGGACVLLAALVTALMAARIYQLDWLAAAILGTAILLGGLALLSGSAFQRAMALQRMVILFQVPNIALLLASGMMAWGVGRIHWFPTLVVAISWMAVGACAWHWVLRNQLPGAPIEARHWRDAVSFGSLSLAAEVMMQLERLLIPLAMGAQALALFAVVAAVALTPYRMLELGTISTLVARLGQAQDAAGRMHMLRRELMLLLSLGVAGGALIVAGAPLLCELVLDERRVSTSLVLAVVVSGIVRLCSALAHSAALAFCEGAQLRRVTAGSWLSVLVGAGLGTALSPLGVEGMIYGVTGGWICRMTLSGMLAVRRLRQPGPSGAARDASATLAAVPPAAPPAT